MSAMVMTSLLPARADNGYRGRRIALWLFGLLLLLRLVMSVNTMLNGYVIAGKADGIPLDSYAPDAARTIVSLFALLGLSIFVFCTLSVLVLVRYRSLIPLMFALLLGEHLGRRVILYFIPIVRVGTPPGIYVNLVLLALMAAGLVLSLWPVRGKERR